MHDDELKTLWRAQTIDPAPPLPGSEQLAAMHSRMRGMNRTLFWRDCRENVAALFVVVVFAIFFFIFTSTLARLGSIVVILGSLFVVAYPIWKRLRIPPAAPEASMMQSLESELRKVQVEIALLRSVLWWYILPSSVGVVLFMAGLNSAITYKLVFIAFAIAFDAFLHWINQLACDKSLVPLQRELESLLRFDDSPPPPPKPRRYIVAKITMLVFILLGIFTIWAGSEREDLLNPPPFQDVSNFTAEDISRIDTYLQRQIAEANYPSLSVAIVRHGQVAYLRSFGFADKISRTLATPETSYHVASVTKVFTSSLAAMLHARGVIDLDQPVTKYLPEGLSISGTPEIGATITLRHLASHTSGLPRGIPGPVQSVEGRYALEPQLLYDHLARIKLVSDPGDTVLYSNLGYGLLGHVLERAAGKPFNQLLQEMLCEPLALRSTAIHLPGHFQLATGYDNSRFRLAEGHSYRKRLAPSGGLITSASDLAKFLAAQTDPGVFSSEVLELLHTPTTLSDGSTARHALGWTVLSSRTAGRFLEKNGGRNNCSAWIGFAPGHRIGVAVLTNCGDPSVDPIGRWLLERSIPGGTKR